MVYEILRFGRRLLGLVVTENISNKHTFLNGIFTHKINIARSEQSSHIPGGSHQRLKHFQRKDKIVKGFHNPKSGSFRENFDEKCPYVSYKNDRRKN